MKRILVAVIAVGVAACGVPAQPAETTSAEIEPPVGAASAAESVSPTDAVVPRVLEVASTGEIEPTTTTTTTAKPQPIVPTATTTSSTVPTVEIDLSELDSLVDELDGLLGSLGAAMNQIEGEFTP
jgi:flagellin-like hook-associated protein FlgL